MHSLLQKGHSLRKNANKRIRRRAQEIINYRADLLNTTSPEHARLLIFGQGRTGSTLLESLLSSTGHFRRNGELLNPAYGEIWSPIRYTRGMSARMPDENFMFHLKIYHLTRDRRRPVEPGAFLNSLHEDGWNIIYLRRRNTVRHQLSNAVLEHRGGPHKFSDDPERHLIEIDCETFVERVRERIQFENAETEALRGVDFCEVTYEDGLEQVDMHQHTVDKILDHISLERRTARTKHKKVNTQDPVDLVANYDEFVEYLTEADLGHFL